MRIIEVHCQTCDVVAVPAEEMVVSECVNAPEHTSYTFKCPTCGEYRIKPANLHAFCLLVAALASTDFLSDEAAAA